MDKNNSFFLDIFNHLLQVNENSILILFDDKQNIWFSLKDVIKSLGYVNVDNAINTMKINPDYKIEYSKIRYSCSQEYLKNMQPRQIFINESGLYEVLSFSKKDLARQFMDKYFKEIMPKIRQTGQYTMNDKDKKNLDKLNKQIENYKTETTYYHNKYKFVPSVFTRIGSSETKEKMDIYMSIKIILLKMEMKLNVLKLDMQKI